MAKKIILKPETSIQKISDRYKKELNAEQFSVVTHKHGAALVIAGAAR